MRAAFDISCNLYDGPGTATPGFPRVVGAPCRLVPDPFFTDTFPPLDASRAYFTIQSAVPAGPTWTPGAPGVYTTDFTMADRAEFSILPGTLYAVVRVETCTWPINTGNYFRASIAPDGSTPSPCSASYLVRYRIKRLLFMFTATVLLIDPTHWTDGTTIVTAEVTAPGLGCNSTWRCVIPTGQIFEGTWNGAGIGVLSNVANPLDTITIGP